MNMNAAFKLASGNLMSPRGKLSYPALITPRANKLRPNDEPRYQVSFLIPPTADIAVLKQAAEAVAREKWGSNLPPKLKNPFLVCGEMIGEKGKSYDDEYDAWLCIRAWSKMAPDIVDGTGQKVTEEREIYAGRWGRVTLRAFAYSNSGNHGVSFGLQNVQLLEHDTPIAGARARAEDEFEPVTTDGGASAGSAFGDANAGAASVFS